MWMGWPFIKYQSQPNKILPSWTLNSVLNIEKPKGLSSAVIWYYILKIKHDPSINHTHLNLAFFGVDIPVTEFCLWASLLLCTSFNFMQTSPPFVETITFVFSAVNMQSIMSTLIIWQNVQLFPDTLYFSVAWIVKWWMIHTEIQIWMTRIIELAN